MKSMYDNISTAWIAMINITSIFVTGQHDHNLNSYE